MNEICSICTGDGSRTDENGTERYGDETLQLRNPHLQHMDQDILYHLALDNSSNNLKEMFGDVKFVCMGGTRHRMETFAYYVMKVIGYKLPTGATLLDITQNSHRYSMFKVGPVLSISHGMGTSSIGILLHEIIKLMFHAKVKDPIFFRIGTCGGIGHKGGTVLLSEETIDGLGNSYYEVPILGKIVRRPAVFSKQLIKELQACVDPKDDYKTVTGVTMCANDFYEGQGRLDGAFCEYTEAEKMKFLQRLKDRGVVNIEMESTVFAALTHHAGIKAANVCVAFLDRLKGDQVDTPKELMHEWQLRPQKLVARYIKKSLRNEGRMCPTNS